ncbi:adenine phosphoribosyltransferase [Oscillospiraceae bacterium OttesenSCG-928-G22]|nr:adenine phosphoribosyltransferase [Oscillospiraceae bacterium OttesenSCG-928-G22]
MEHTMTIAGKTRSLPLCKITDDLYIGAFIIFGDVELTEAAAAELLRRAPAFDLLITAESKGIPLIYEMTRQAGKSDYIVARKAEKLYMKDAVTVSVKSITTAKVQTLVLDRSDMEKLRGRRIILLDDVVSTGESLRALEKLVRDAGGDIVAKMTILAEGDAAGRDDLIYLEKLPLFDGAGNPI